MATEIEVLAAQLFVASSVQLGEPVEQWVLDLALEEPNGIPAYDIPLEEE
jgi:hypothetical protein